VVVLNKLDLWFDDLDDTLNRYRTSNIWRVLEGLTLRACGHGVTPILFPTSSLYNSFHHFKAPSKQFLVEASHLSSLLLLAFLTHLLAEVG